MTNTFRSSRTSFQENFPEHHVYGGTFEKKRKSIPSMQIFRLVDLSHNMIANLVNQK